MHRRTLLTTVAVVATATLGLAACTDDGGDAPGADLPRGDEEVDLDPDDLTTEIDHPLWPMEPGTRWRYRELDEDGKEVEVVVTVTTETRVVANGVTARVVRDTVTEEGEVVEDTFDWYAQDADGNVWYLGEDTAELDDGEITTREGSFEAGVDGALAGIILPADPAVGMSYRQEHAEGEAEDAGEVLALDQQVEVPAGRFTGALLTEDTNALEPDVVEYKLYAPGVGPVLTLDISGGAGREELLERTTVPEDVARAAGTVPLGEPYMRRSR